MSKTVKIIKAIKFINKYNIQNATLTDEGQINVDGDVNLSNKNLTDSDMTAKFGRVTGNFECPNNIMVKHFWTKKSSKKVFFIAA